MPVQPASPLPPTQTNIYHKGNIKGAKNVQFGAWKGPQLNNLQKLKRLHKISDFRRDVVDTPALPISLRGVDWYLVTGLELLYLWTWNPYASNYMFRPNVAIIRFSSESMVVVLYRIGMGMSRWWDLNMCDVCYMLFLRGTGGGSVMCAILGCTAQVCLLAAVLCGSAATVGFCHQQ